MSHRNDRGAREAVTAAVGERGRRTGAVMPRQGDIPLTQDGFEDPDAFFKSPVAASTSHNRITYSSSKSRRADSEEYGQYSQSRGAVGASQRLPSSATKRHQARPDVTHEIGVRGRKTGMAIAPSGKVARTSDGMEDVDAFFAANPASVPPIRKTKRVSKIVEEDDYADDRDRDEYEEETANYSKGRRKSYASRTGRQVDENEEEEEEEEEDDDEDEDGYDGGGDGHNDQEEASYTDENEEADLTDATEVEEDEEDAPEDEYGAAESEEIEEENTSRASAPFKRQRQSGGKNTSRVQPESDNEFADNNDGSGTRSMSLDGSSYFNKSTTKTFEAMASQRTQKDRGNSRLDDYDDSRLPPRQRGTPSTSGSATQASRLPIASTSKTRLPIPRDEGSSSANEEEEEEAIHNSLTKSAQARRRRTSGAAVGGQGGSKTYDQTTPSPSRNAKGKGRQSLFAAPSSETPGRSRNAGYNSRIHDEQPLDAYDDDDDNDDEEGGFQPAAPEDDGYNDYDPAGDDYPEAMGADDERGNEDDGRLSEQEEEDPQGGYEDEDGPDPGDDYGHDSRRRQDGEDEAEDGYSDVSDELPPPLRARGNVSSRSAVHDSGHEEENEVDLPESLPPRPSGRPKKQQQARVGASQIQPRKPRSRIPEDHPEGVRRSHRDRTSPVAYWRGEHVIYQRRDSPSGAAYYEKVGIADRPKPIVKSLVNRHKRSRSASQGAAIKASANKRAKTRSVSVATDGEADPDGQEGFDNDWSKWDEETDPNGIVWDYVEGAEHQRRIAFTATMCDPKLTKHGYKFQRFFTDGEYMATGLLVLPPGQKKPLKPAKDNTYAFFCHQGAVRVLVHRTEFSIAKGGSFLIPRGNSYQINNLTDIDAILIFTQARELAAILDGEGEE